MVARNVVRWLVPVLAVLVFGCVLLLLSREAPCDSCVGSCWDERSCVFPCVCVRRGTGPGTCR